MHVYAFKITYSAGAGRDSRARACQLPSQCRFDFQRLGISCSAMDPFRSLTSHFCKTRCDVFREAFR